MNKKSIWEAYRFSIILIGAIIIGSFIGVHFGEKAKVLKPLGDLFINGMFTIVVPLVFVTISSSISSMSDMTRLKKYIKKPYFSICFNRCSSCSYYFNNSKYFSTSSRS